MIILAKLSSIFPVTDSIQAIKSLQTSFKIVSKIISPFHFQYSYYH